MTRGNSMLALSATIAAATLGILLALSVPSAVFPEIQFNRALVNIDAGDLPPQQMAVAVTRPLEEAAYGVVGVRLVRSTTTRGNCRIFSRSGRNWSSGSALVPSDSAFAGFS